MMLPPFRIRDLYGQARHGIVQITMPEYNDTMKSYPNAALRYLDEDDGETITIGSGFELRQRLEDPVPATLDEEQTNPYHYTPQDIHTFDIETTSNSIAVWMEHEAYSSKSLRSSSRSSEDSVESTSRTDELKPETTVHKAWSADVLRGAQKATEPSKEFAKSTELDMYEEMYDKEVQTTSSMTNEAKPLTEVSDPCPTNDKQQGMDTAEKIVSDTMHGIASSLESHFDTLADFLQNTSKAFRVVAEKTREYDTSAVESILSGFNVIFAEVGELAKAVLDATEAAPAACPVELDLQQVHQTLYEKGKAREKEEAMTEAKDNELSASVEVSASHVADLPSEVLASTARPTVRVETMPAQHSRVSSQTSSGSEFAAHLAMSKLDRTYHIPSKSSIDGQLQEVPAEKDQAYAFPEQRGFDPDSHRTWDYMPLADDDKPSKTKKKVDFALPQGVVRPREAAKWSAETFPRSILDLDASDPDFSARFPPLMSVRRSKTMDSLRQRSQSPDNQPRSRQDALKRFPSVGQLERRKVFDDHARDRKEDNARKVMKSEEQHVSRWHPAWYDTVDVKPLKSVNNCFARQSDEVEEIIAAVGRDVAEASNEVRRLPGAWPEAQVDSKTILPTSRESSGAFFNRMTGQIASPDTKRNSASENPYLVQRPLSEYRDEIEGHKRKHLERAKPPILFKPSATLTTPFDPLMSSTMAPDFLENSDDLSACLKPEHVQPNLEALLSSNQSTSTKVPINDIQDWYNTPKQVGDQIGSKKDGIHRSATDKMPYRRPYAHRYSGAGRLPWENFEDRSFDLRTGSHVQRQERVRRAADRPAPVPSVFYDEATRMWNLSEPTARKPDGNTSTRQNPTHPIKLPSDLHKRVNEYRTGLRHRASMPAVNTYSARQKKIDDCIQQLKDMGFGEHDKNEASRLSVYAAATGGDIFEAVGMIEEDRRAGDTLKHKGQAKMPGNTPHWWL